MSSSKDPRKIIFASLLLLFLIVLVFTIISFDDTEVNDEVVDKDLVVKEGEAYYSIQLDPGTYDVQIKADTGIHVYYEGGGDFNSEVIKERGLVESKVGNSVIYHAVSEEKTSIAYYGYYGEELYYINYYEDTITITEPCELKIGIPSPSQLSFEEEANVTVKIT